MGFFKKILGKTGEKSVKDVDFSSKADIIFLYEEGYKPSEIAQETGVSAEKIYKIIEIEKDKRARRQARTAEPIDEIATLNLELKKQELEMRKKELEWELEDREAERQAELQSQQAELAQNLAESGDGESATISILTSFLGGLARKQVTPNYRSESFSQTRTPESGFIELSDNEINEILAQHPDQTASLQKLPDATILRIFRQKFPDVSVSTYQRALSCIKKMKVISNGGEA